MTHATDITTTALFIDGSERPAHGDARYAIHNPARPTELVGYAADASAQDVDDAVRAAHAAFPSWSRLSHGERATRLRQVADALAADADDVAQRSRLFTREHGKIARETLLEMTRLGDRFRQVADYGDRIAVDEEIKGPPFDTLVTRQGAGVAALIVPWNWPLSILGAKLPQALVTGNTVVVKVSEFAALAPTLTLSKLAALFPPGVVNVITGDGVRIGDPLTSHPLVRRVNFTGSVKVGKRVMKSAANNLTPVTLELGGNDPAIVLEDAKL
ncbi:MAG: aldehyde dehydrogenase family protein, partial [Pseudomonadota bacterium]